jgi:hypothetical protein
VRQVCGRGRDEDAPRAVRPQVTRVIASVCSPIASNAPCTRPASAPAESPSGDVSCQDNSAAKPHENSRRTGSSETCSPGPGRRDYLFVRGPGRRATNFWSKRYSICARATSWGATVI